MVKTSEGKLKTIISNFLRLVIWQSKYYLWQ